ncbi:MAG: mobile mystery protein A [Gemmatimonadetes bacterium]|nr:mobile mystery protein A [Gemmatimonadota bacterium]NNM34544.1 mobile mystery protein A [Gemmatimonadota bacterium]
MKRLTELRIRQLDEILAPFKALQARPRPEQGWARTIREALGMSRRQLGERIGLSYTSVSSIETHEAKGTVQLDSLRRLAEGMDCELVYALVPRDSLRTAIRDQARRVAESMVNRVSDSMDLELQSVAESERERAKREIAEGLASTRGRDFWDVRE